MSFHIRIFSWALIFIFKIMNGEILLPCCKQVCFKTIWKRTNVCDVLPKFLLFPFPGCPGSCTWHFFQFERGIPLTNRVKRTMLTIQVTTSMVTKIDVIYFLCDHMIIKCLTMFQNKSEGIKLL